MNCHLSVNFNLSEQLSLSGGRNNLLAVASSRVSGHKVVVKAFPAERRERFTRETHFLAECEKSHVMSVPTLLDSCAEHQVVVMTHEIGNRLTEFSRNHEEQIIEFLLSIQNPTLNTERYPEAIEAVWSAEDFKSSLRRRTAPLHSRVSLLGKRSPAKVWLELAQRYMESALHLKDLEWLESMLRTTSRIPGAGQRFLSPSDLGMHNCLNRKGKLIFLDFEYAGTDSGINLVGDLVMQPDSVWSSRKPFYLGERILHALFGSHTIELEIIQRLFGLRWALIMLLRDPHLARPAVASGLSLETLSYISPLAKVLDQRL